MSSISQRKRAEIRKIKRKYCKEVLKYKNRSSGAAAVVHASPFSSSSFLLSPYLHMVLTQLHRRHTEPNYM